MSTTLFSAAAFIAVVWLYLKLAQMSDAQESIIEIKSSTPQACLDIINAKSFNSQGYTIKNHLTNYEARAIPNERLVRTFAIHNSFVTSQKEESAAFRKTGEGLMYVDEGKWVEFASAARTIVHQSLDATQPSIKLGDLVQLITLKMVRKVFFHIEPTVSSPGQIQETDEKLRVLARAITMQWLASKSDPSGARDGNDTAVQKQMQDALMTAFPEWDGSNRADNPFNLILPAYETVWRVVLLCSIEVCARSHSASGSWSAALQEFLNNPTREKLEKPLATGVSDEHEPISAMMVAKEVLRLYPPTRRVYRRFEAEDGRKYSLAADIETMQRDSAVWGEDATIFRPERWAAVTQAMEDDGRWLPFGAKPFRCPAKRHQGVPMPFGVSMISLLTGALLEAIEGRWEFVGDLPAAGVPLETGRGAYEDVKLVKLSKEKQP